VPETETQDETGTATIAELGTEATILEGTKFGTSFD
jgi:hypothetical protein